MIRLNKDIKGITLMELVVAMVLLAVIVLGATAFDSASHSFFAESRRKAHVVNEMSLILEHIGKYTEQAVGNKDDPGILVNPSAPPVAAYSCPVSACGAFCIFIRNDEGGTLNWHQYEYDGCHHRLIFFPDPADRDEGEVLSSKLVGFSVIMASPEINGIVIRDLKVIANLADPDSTSASIDADASGTVEPEEYISFYSFSHSTN